MLRNREKNPNAVWSIILGIFSFISCSVTISPLFFVGLALAIIAILLGISGLKSNSKKSSIVGLIIGILAFLNCLLNQL